MYRIKGFHTVITNYRVTKGGGTMIQVGEKTILIEEVDSGLPESISILVEIGGNKLIIALAYVPPRFNKNQLVDELDKEIENLSRFNLPTILAGDFKIDNLQQSYLDSITANGFELLNKSATRNCDS